NDKDRKIPPISDVDSMYKISFFKLTTVTRIELFDNNTRSFILEPYNHLLDPIQHQYYETDAVGIGIGDIVPIMFAAGKKICRTVVVEDVDKWDEYAYKREAMRHVVFILQLAKVKYWDGTPAIHNALFGTKIYVNREIPKIVAFRTRVQEHEGYVKEMVSGIRDSEPVIVRLIDQAQRLWFCSIIYLFKAFLAYRLGMKAYRGVRENRLGIDEETRYRP
ncbi:hypothetical protein Tco_0952904, partial [Tanacetum coccineum]